MWLPFGAARYVWKKSSWWISWKTWDKFWSSVKKKTHQVCLIGFCATLLSLVSLLKPSFLQFFHFSVLCKLLHVDLSCLISLRSVCCRSDILPRAVSAAKLLSHKSTEKDYCLIGNDSLYTSYSYQFSLFHLTLLSFFFFFTQKSQSSVNIKDFPG